MSSFKNVVGHNEIIQYIQDTVRNGTYSHAYILNGAKGSGKKMLSGLFAMSLQCEDLQPDGDACGKCHSCKQALSGNHPDIITVTHESPNTIGVGEIRDQVVADIEIKPYQSPHKIYIIPDADMLSVQAQNSLLKTLEEPPAYAVILLLTRNAETLLDTIRSRCVVLKLRNIRDTLVKMYLLEQIDIPDDKANICVAFAQGNIGQALKLATNEDFDELRDDLVQLLTKINQMAMPQVFDAVKHTGKYKISVVDYLDLISIWYRDILIYKATRNPNRIVFTDQLPHLKERAIKSSYEGIEKILSSIEKTKARLRANVNFELSMELLFLTIKEN